MVLRAPQWPPRLNKTIEWTSVMVTSQKSSSCKACPYFIQARKIVLAYASVTKLLHKSQVVFRFPNYSSMPEWLGAVTILPNHPDESVLMKVILCALWWEWDLDDSPQYGSDCLRPETKSTIMLTRIQISQASCLPREALNLLSFTPTALSLSGRGWQGRVFSGCWQGRVFAECLLGGTQGQVDYFFMCWLCS